jgi:hypothetical protein
MSKTILKTLAVLLAAKGSCQAFGGKYHEQITRQALKGLLRPSEIKTVVAADLDVDEQETWGVPEAHFDSESFSKGSARLRRKRQAALEMLAAGDRRGALLLLGQALHAIQDFFSHSNFVENNPVDAQIDLLSLQDPPADLRCVPPGFKGGLTSGYYSNTSSEHPDDVINEPPLKGVKCSHGQLNKDEPDRPGFRQAKEKAILESRRFARDLLAARRPARLK